MPSRFNLAKAAIQERNLEEKRAKQNELNRNIPVYRAYGKNVSPNLKKIYNNRRKSVNLDLQALQGQGIVSAAISRASSPTPMYTRRSRRHRRRTTRKARKSTTRRNRK